MRYLKSYYHYDVSSYNKKCPICNRIAISDKALVDHLFHRNWKDEKHKCFAEHLRGETLKTFKFKAINICPVCKERYLRTLASHFNNRKDHEHIKYMSNNTNLILDLFLSGKSPIDIQKEIGINYKWIWRIVINSIGKEKAKQISKTIHAKKRKQHWAMIPSEERKRKMIQVRDAEWGKLTPAQRQRHPWVIAGQKASLESIKKGSRNQLFAFELLCKKCDEFDWRYNFIVKGEWQIDIASPSRGVYIEWDGKHHRKPMFGIQHLQKVQNRDKQKNKLVTQQLNGTLIRVEDNGRFNPHFVDEVTDEIVDLIERSKLDKAVYYLNYGD